MSSSTIPPTEPENAHLGHETSDVHVRTVLWFGLVVAVGTVAVAVLLLFLLRHYRAEASRRDPQLSPLAGAPFEPAGPQLQHTPIADYEQFRDRQEEHLHSYGWVNREQGIVRMPIERAMEIALERGLPSPRGSFAPEAEPPQPPADEAPAHTAEPE
jgi:hypothetical protein